MIFTQEGKGVCKHFFGLFISSEKCQNIKLILTWHECCFRAQRLPNQASVHQTRCVTKNRWTLNILMCTHSLSRHRLHSKALLGNSNIHYFFIFRANRQTSSLTALDQSCRRRSDFVLMTSQNSHLYSRCQLSFLCVIFFSGKKPNLVE